jgi:ABC-2 type transport system ATP-binding protein
MLSAQHPHPLAGVTNLNHQRGTFHLGPINLGLEAGQSVALVGGNGAGKSTLIRCIAGLLTPKSGTVDLMGLPLSSPARRKQLAYLPERFSPPYFMTGNEFIVYYLGLCDAEPTVSSELLQLLRMDTDTLSKPVHTLSKGTAQKLGLAAVLATNRPLLLLDEPFSGLDPEARSGLRAAMVTYVQQGGCLLFSTHLFEGMDDFVDRMLILHQGQIRFDGSPAICRAQSGQESLDKAFLQQIYQA